MSIQAKPYAETVQFNTWNVKFQFNYESLNILKISSTYESYLMLSFFLVKQS